MSLPNKIEVVEALVRGYTYRGIQEAGEGLTAHFPYSPAKDSNEHSDKIDFGPNENKKKR